MLKYYVAMLEADVVSYSIIKIEECYMPNVKEIQ